MNQKTLLAADKTPLRWILRAMWTLIVWLTSTWAFGAEAVAPRILLDQQYGYPRLDWTNVLGHTYLIQTRERFDQGDWSPLVTLTADSILGTVLDSSGGSLDGNYDLTRQGSPADDFVWTFKFPLPNDGFAGAQAISGGSGQVNGSNRGASFEVDEPFYRWSGLDSAWYQWKPPRKGPFTFDLVGAAFDTMLDVFVVRRDD